MISLSWPQVNAWRLSRQYLLQRADRGKLLEAVSHLGGIQAQVISAAEMALGARVEGLAPTEVQNALWRDRSLIKTWAMRGTLHLLASSDFPLYVGARSEQLARVRHPPSYYQYHGVTPDELEAIIANIPLVLTGEPMTREQLASAIAERAGKPNLRAVLLSGWGALLKPSAQGGDLCFGPNQGQNVTFVRPAEWIGAWRGLEAGPALQEIARRYLSAYGPAAPEDFARWWGTDAGPAKRLFRSLGDELAPVEVEGWSAWALASILPELEVAQAPHAVRLLPQFDAYTIGVSRDCEPILAGVHKARVYRPQGWISAVVLVDGRMEGVWESETQGPKRVLKVEMFLPPSASVKRGLEAEAGRLGEFLGLDAELVYANS
jgi:hypothetical protein